MLIVLLCIVVIVTLGLRIANCFTEELAYLAFMMVPLFFLSLVIGIFTAHVIASGYPGVIVESRELVLSADDDQSWEFAHDKASVDGERVYEFQRLSLDGAVLDSIPVDEVEIIRVNRDWGELVTASCSYPEDAPITWLKGISVRCSKDVPLAKLCVPYAQSSGNSTVIVYKYSARYSFAAGFLCLCMVFMVSARDKLPKKYIFKLVFKYIFNR